ncbi:hypothetical protein ACTFIR_002828 [Dictyostelium discoideum]
MKLLFCLILFQLIVLIKSEREYFKFREDVRRCSKPKCGGYFLKKLNSGPYDEIYVSSFIMVNGNLNPMEIEGYDQNIISGYVIPSGEDDGCNAFFLKGIHERMVIPDAVNNYKIVPSNIFKNSESFFFLSSSQNECIQSDGCPIYKSIMVNFNESTNFESYTEPYTSSVPLLDLNWFNSRLIKKIFIVLILVQLFLVPTFSRSVDRCPIFEKCVARSVCHLGIPTCPKGYKSYS